jgi:hypothetical protein
MCLILNFFPNSVTQNLAIFFRVKREVILQQNIPSFSILFFTFWLNFTSKTKFWSHLWKSLYIWSGHYARKVAGWRLFDHQKHSVMPGCLSVMPGFFLLIFFNFCYFLLLFFTACNFYKLFFIVEGSLFVTFFYYS